MVKLYGIKTCGSVRKAMQFLDGKGVAYTFIDFKKQKPTQEELEMWIKGSSLNVLFNKKGTTYKKLGLKDLQLSEDDIKMWLLKEPLLIKRPVIVKDKEVIVGFEGEMYAKIWK